MPIHWWNTFGVAPHQQLRASSIWTSIMQSTSFVRAWGFQCQCLKDLSQPFTAWQQLVILAGLGFLGMNHQGTFVTIKSNSVLLASVNTVERTRITPLWGQLREVTDFDSNQTTCKPCSNDPKSSKLWCKTVCSWSKKIVEWQGWIGPITNSDVQLLCYCIVRCCLSGNFTK